MSLVPQSHEPVVVKEKPVFRYFHDSLEFNSGIFSGVWVETYIRIRICVVFRIQMEIKGKMNMLNVKQLFMIVSMIDECSIYSDTTNLCFADRIYVFFTQNFRAIGAFFRVVTYST